MKTLFTTVGLFFFSPPPQWLKISRVKREHRAASVVLLPFDIVPLTARGCNRPHREKVPNLPGLAGLSPSGSSTPGRKAPVSEQPPVFLSSHCLFLSGLRGLYVDIFQCKICFCSVTASMKFNKLGAVGSVQVQHQVPQLRPKP